MHVWPLVILMILIHVPVNTSFCTSPYSIITNSQRRLTLYMGVRGKKIRKEIRKEKEMETPPRFNTPYGPIRYNRPLTMCDICVGLGKVYCNVCQGSGMTRATGQRRRNTVNPTRIAGSRWTSVEIRAGHRHYVCMESRGSRKKNNLELRMTNSCGPEEDRVDLWIPEEELRDKMSWRMGWVTMQEIEDANEGPLIDAKVCFRCKGSRILSCQECFGRGKLGYFQAIHNI